MFNFFKKKSALEIYAPISGKILPLSASPDEAFAQGMLGEGLCIEPDGNVIHAPFNGEFDIFHTLHAVGCKSGDVEIIVHVGMNTVDLKGEGFTLRAKELVLEANLGEPLFEFDREFLMSKVSTLITPMIVVSKPEKARLEIVKTEGTVKEGDLLMIIHL